MTDTLKKQRKEQLIREIYAEIKQIENNGKGDENNETRSTT